MKHTLPVTLILVSVFLLSQVVGLALLSAGAEVVTDSQGGTAVQHDQPAFTERPETTGYWSFVYLVIGLAIGTGALLLLVRYRLFKVWKAWFFIAVLAATTIALGTLMNEWVALGFAAVLAVWKIWRPNIWIHNITEVLVYSGIAILIAPIFNLFYATLLLIAIAVYDAWAVWHSKHMVRMANFQTESRLFAGLFIPYERGRTSMAPSRGSEQERRAAANAPARNAPAGSKAQPSRNAILGGGDIAFPLLFASVVFSTLLGAGLGKVAAFSYSLIVVASSTAALAGLFFYARKDAFYPAMPFLTAGCLVGYGIIWLLI
jgi:presenilin-like A22 family membrane protease